MGEVIFMPSEKKLFRVQNNQWLKINSFEFKRAQKISVRLSVGFSVSMDANKFDFSFSLGSRE